MTIEVEGPGGVVVEFPDGTPPATIQGAMSRHFGSPQFQHALADSRANNQRGMSNPVTAGISHFADQMMRGRTLGFSDELAGAARAAGVGLSNLAGHGPGYGMADAYKAERQAAQEGGDSFSAAHPVAAAAMQLVGGVKAPGMKAAGSFIKAAPNLPQAMARAGLVGSGYGAVAGTGSAPDGQRVSGAAQGAAWGAGTGAAMPVVGAVARPLLRAGGGAVADIARGVKNSIRPPDPTAPPTPADLALAQLKVRQMLDAARATTDSLTAHPAVVAGKPLTTAEAIGRTGINNLGALARRSGPTGDALAPMLVDRHGQAPARIMQDFASAAGIHPEAASGDIQGLTDKLRTQAAPLYDAALSDPSPVWNTDLATLVQRPVIKKAIASVGQDFLNAGKDPMTAGLQLDPDTGLHVLNPDLTAANERQPTAATWDAVKKAISRQVERNPITGRVLPDSQSQGNFGVMSASRDLTSALAGDPANGVDGAIPGYRAALDKAGDYLQLEDAYGKGAKLLTDPKVNEASFADIHAGMDEASQHAFKGGFANKLYDMAQNGQLSPAKFRTPRIQEKLAAVLGSDNAASFLRNVQLEGQLAANGNRMMPGVNSPTFEFGNAAQEQEGGFNPIQAIMHGHINPFKAIGGLLDAGRAVATGPQVRGEMGRLLMQNPAASASELSLVPPPPKQGLFGSQYYPAVAAQVAQQLGS